MPICADGHTSTADDYCDVCGAPIGGDPPASIVAQCPACGAARSGRFCEICGHDSALPEPATPPRTARVVWTAVIDADWDFYQRVIARGGPDTVEFPHFFPERRIILRRKATLIGRRNRNQGVEPDIDLGIQPVDRGVSTQHAVLRIRDSALTVADLGSTNGTSLNGSDTLLQKDEEVALGHGDRIHVGAWTTITIEADPPNRSALP
jgi:hypothetical protein